MKKSFFKISFVLIALLFIYCVVNILAARYYRLLEQERKIFLGLRGIDSLAANEYLNLASATERAAFYKSFWADKEEERLEFEKRIEHAFYKFGKYAPLSDDRIPIYVKYGPPSRRETITPEKKIAVKVTEVVKPAEVWTYKAQGIIFDFIRIARAYELIAQSDFGDKVRIPYLKEVIADTTIVDIESPQNLSFEVTTGRFRQKKNLTRLEIYITLGIEDTTGSNIYRNIKIFDKNGFLVEEKMNILIPQNEEEGIFFDEVNLWLIPEQYRLEIELIDLKNNRVGKEILMVDLIDYKDDAKEISDIIPAKLIDDAFSHEKFNKPVGRVVPLVTPVLTVHKPFYFYTEAYNLETKNGMHNLRTTYEVYNKEKMRKEVVDIMIKDWIESGDIAYLATQYHPMDLSPGYYIIVIRVKDLISGKERTAVTEFELTAQ